jgi:replicative DNA helicase
MSKYIKEKLNSQEIAHAKPQAIEYDTTEQYLHEENIIVQLALFPNKLYESESLKLKYFRLSYTRRCYNSILKLFHEGTPITPHSIIQKSYEIYSIDDADFFAEIISRSTHVGPIANSIMYLKNSHLRVDIMARLSRMHLRAKTQSVSTTPTTLSNFVLRHTQALIASMRGHDESQSTLSVEYYCNELKNDITLGLEKQALNLPWAPLNNLLGGFTRGDLVVVAGRTGMGKTAFALNLAMNMAAQKMNILFFSLEMRGMSLTMRLLSATAQIDYGILARSNSMSDIDIISALSGLDKLAELPLLINEGRGMTLSDIKLEIAMRNSSKQLDLVIIDYVGLIQTESPTLPRHLQISEIVISLKDVAVQCNLALILLSQVSREVEKIEGADHVPQLHHLSESGALEMNADSVLLLYRPSYYLKVPPVKNVNSPEYKEWESKIFATQDQLYVYVAKNRNGPTGDIILFYNPRFSHIRVYAKNEF